MFEGRSLGLGSVSSPLCVFDYIPSPRSLGVTTIGLWYSYLYRLFISQAFQQADPRSRSDCSV